jgi:hypothetical protein
MKSDYLNDEWKGMGLDIVVDYFKGVTPVTSGISEEKHELLGHFGRCVLYVCTY